MASRFPLCFPVIEFSSMTADLFFKSGPYDDPSFSKLFRIPGQLFWPRAKHFPQQHDLA